MLPLRSARLLHGGAIAVGALAGALLPFVTHESSSPAFTDIEARLGWGALAILANALFGALAGWAIGALIRHFWRYGR